MPFVSLSSEVLSFAVFASGKINCSDFYFQSTTVGKISLISLYSIGTSVNICSNFQLVLVLVKTVFLEI